MRHALEKQRPGPNAGTARRLRQRLQLLLRLPVDEGLHLPIDPGSGPPLTDPGTAGTTCPIHRVAWLSAASSTARRKRAPRSPRRSPSPRGCCGFVSSSILLDQTRESPPESAPASTSGGRGVARPRGGTTRFPDSSRSPRPPPRRSGLPPQARGPARDAGRFPRAWSPPRRRCFAPGRSARQGARWFRRSPTARRTAPRERTTTSQRPARIHRFDSDTRCDSSASARPVDAEVAGSGFRRRRARVERHFRGLAEVSSTKRPPRSRVSRATRA